MAYYSTHGRHHITSPYGYRFRNGKITLHRGIDYVSEDSKEQFLDENRQAKILFAGIDPAGGGNMVRWQYEDGSGGYYLHCATLYVRTGDPVLPTKVLALEGKTGDATGVHTHHTKLRNAKDGHSYYNFTLEERTDMSNFDKILIYLRPDWRTSDGRTPTDIWNEGGYLEFLLDAGKNGNASDSLLVRRLYEAQAKGDVRGYLRDLLQYYWIKEDRVVFDKKTSEFK